jgi:tetratricopeptide (TPR) repeat protein
MTGEFGYEANLRRGQLLRESGRSAEARGYLGEAIQANPHQPQAYLEMALVESDLPGRKKEALRAIDQAVALAPLSAHFLGYKAYLLSQFGRHQDALEMASQALQIDPNRSIALLARTNAYTKLKRWVEAEISSRRMLQLNPSDTGALNLLAQSLRLQERVKESREIIAQILALTPNDSFGHANAGYGALKAGDHLRANRHFLESLRGNPQDDFARRGLLQSLRARMFVYRCGFNLVIGTSGFGRGGMVLFVILNIATGGLIFALLVLYFIFAVTLQPLSNFFLLFHRAGRRALTRKEWCWAVFTGVIAISLLMVAVVTRLAGLVIFLGVYLLLFALSVLLPQFVDAGHARREERLVAKA